jgi:hypothetical protein
MFIPCSVTLTEKEYGIVLQLARTLAPGDYAFSAAVRQIIAEWEEQKTSTADSGRQTDECRQPTAGSRKPPKGSQS